MTARTLTMAVHAAAFLPTVLSAFALRVDEFTVRDDRGGSGSWLVETNRLPQETIIDLLEVLPVHMASVHAFGDSV